MTSNGMHHEQDDNSMDAVLSRIVDPEVRACLIDLTHAIEASEGNQLARRRFEERRRANDPDA